MILKTLVIFYFSCGISYALLSKSKILYKPIQAIFWYLLFAIDLVSFYIEISISHEVRKYNKKINRELGKKVYYVNTKDISDE